MDDSERLTYYLNTMTEEEILEYLQVHDCFTQLAWLTGALKLLGDQLKSVIDKMALCHAVAIADAKGELSTYTLSLPESGDDNVLS